MGVHLHSFYLLTLFESRSSDVFLLFLSLFLGLQIYRFNKWSATRSFHRQKKMAEAERLGKLAPGIEVPTGRPSKFSVI